MKFLKTFLGGLVVSAVIVAALFYRFQYFGPAGQRPVPTAETDKANLPPAKFPTAIIEGSVDIAPLLAAQATKAKTSALAITIWHMKEDDTSELVGHNAVESPKFPAVIRVELSEAFTEDLIQAGKPADLRVMAIFCPNKTRDSCYHEALPISRGSKDVTVKPPATPVNAASSPLLALASYGELVIDRSTSAPHLADCVRSGLTLSGKIQPTESLVTEPSHPSRYALVALPRDRYEMSAPFIASDHSPLTRAEMAAAAESKIVFTGFSLAGSKPVPFSLKLPKGSELMPRNFLAVACNAGEDDTACAAKAFPSSRSNALSYPKIGVTRLIPKGLEDPMCGIPTILYFNNWKLDAPAATIEDFKKAQLPEIVEGMRY